MTPLHTHKPHSLTDSSSTAPSWIPSAPLVTRALGANNTTPLGKRPGGLCLAHEPNRFYLEWGDALPPSTLLGCLALLFSTLPTSQRLPPAPPCAFEELSFCLPHTPLGSPRPAAVRSWGRAAMPSLSSEQREPPIPGQPCPGEPFI